MPTYRTDLPHVFLWPVATGRLQAVVNAIPNTEYIDLAAQGAPSFLPMLKHTRPNGNIILAYCTLRIRAIAIPHLGLSAGTNQQWNVYQIMPKALFLAGSRDAVRPRPPRLGSRIMTALGRFIFNNAELNQDAQGRPYTGLPMTLQQVVDFYPAVANVYLRPQRAIVDGNGEPTGATEPIPGSAIMIDPAPAAGVEFLAAQIDWRPSTDDIQQDAIAPDDAWPEA